MIKYESKTESYIKNVIKTKILAKYRDRIFWFWPAASVFGRQSIPDLILCINGFFVCVETKKSIGVAEIRLPKYQEFTRREILKAGGLHFIVYNAATIKQLEEWIKILLKQKNEFDFYLQE